MTIKETADEIIAKAEGVISRPLEDFEKTLITFAVTQIKLELVEV